MVYNSFYNRIFSLVEILSPYFCISNSLVSIASQYSDLRATMATHRFNPTFTDNVINAMGPKTTPRVRKLMAGLIRHMHDYAREEELTVDEWMAGVQMLNWAGQMSDDKRNEGQLVCDVLGLES